MSDTKAPERIWAQDADPNECRFIGGGWWDDCAPSHVPNHMVEYVRADLYREKVLKHLSDLGRAYGREDALQAEIATLRAALAGEEQK